MSDADPFRPPPKLRRNILPWIVACDLIECLHDLPIGLRLPRLKKTPAGPKLSIPDYPPELVHAWETVKVLLAKGHAAACKEFNRRFASSVMRLPRLRPIGNRGETGERGAVEWVHPDYGNRRHNTFFPPALSLWLMLNEWQVHSRVKQCAECNSLFLDYTRGVSMKYCSKQCTSRTSSRDYRMAGKASRA